MSTAFSPLQLRAAVAAICPDIEAQLRSTVRAAPNDEELWYQLSCCLLSSQVPYPLAEAAATAIARDGVLSGSASRTQEEIQTRLEQVFSAKFLVGGSSRRFRFPNLKSRQLAATWCAITGLAGSISAAVAEFSTVDEARRWLVDNAPGLGPKQASMFLRNSGISYNLAVLDRHVLTYMDALDLDRTRAHNVHDLTSYCAKEAQLQFHASEIGYPVGMVDWAIWIVMRVANRERGRGREQ